MRDGKNRELALELPQCLANGGFARRIQRARGLVQNQQARAMDQGTRNQHPLALAAGEAGAALAHRCLDALRQLLHEIPCPRCLERAHGVGLAELGIPQRDVVQDTFVQQQVLLGNVADQASP